MKIKLDENLSRYLKPILQQEGYEVRTAEDEGQLGKSDVEIESVTKNEGMVLFTLDLEFGDLRTHTPPTS